MSDEINTSNTEDVDCRWFPVWEDPNTCDCWNDGYKFDDGFYKVTLQIGDDCQYKLARSLTNVKNKDNPFDGINKEPPTWEIKSLSEVLSEQGDGSDGPQGPQGVAGIQGPQGLQGIAGEQGPQGIAGQDGNNTNSHLDDDVESVTGTAVDNTDPRNPIINSTSGTQGPQGIAGRDGVDGAIGPQGPQGVAGQDAIVEDLCKHFYTSADDIRAEGVPTECFELTLLGDQHGNFLWESNSTNSEDGINGSAGTTITPTGNTGSGRWIRQTNKNEYYNNWFSNDVDGIQRALDVACSNSGGTVYITSGEYETSIIKGSNDKWGINIQCSNIKLEGVGNPNIKRSESSIANFSDAYPILMIGKPDSNLESDIVENITIQGLSFEGLNQQHSSNGDAPHDGRTAIELKNTKGVVITNNKFEKIDSEAITYQYPAIYDYENSEYYNITKNYNSTISNNTFSSVPHNIVGRPLIHAITMGGLDGLICTNNYFDWCDNALSGFTSYESTDQTENDMYSPNYNGWVLGQIKRCGRSWAISHNNITNSSEHAIYAIGMEINITSNVIRTDFPELSRGDDIKVRAKNVIVDGNNISGSPFGIGVHEPSRDVIISNNVLNITGETEAGGIDVNAETLEDYIDARGWLNDYKPVSNIIIKGNTIVFPEEAADGIKHIAFRIYTRSGATTNFPQETINGVIIKDNLIKNHKYGLYVIGDQITSYELNGNTFLGKPFTRSSFNSSSTMNTEATMLIYATSVFVAGNMRMINNYVDGSNYIFTTHTGVGNNVLLPWGISENRFDYIKNIVISGTKVLNSENKFTNNIGWFFLDRSWIGGTQMNNALNNGSTTGSMLTSQFLYDGTDLRYYNSDTSYITL